MTTFDIFKDVIPTLLTIVLPLIIIGIVFSIIKNWLSTSSKFNSKYKYQKRNLLTKNELAFYKVLSPIATKNGMITFTKVRLFDLIEPKKGSNNRQESQNKISQKHIDFVLCDNININPVLVIELDDKTHDREDRQQRDIFVDHALETAGIQILHTRTTDKLEENIMKKIKSPSITSTKK